MNRSTRQHLPSVVKNSNSGNSEAADTNRSSSGQNYVFNPLDAQWSSMDLSATGQDERVLDCSDWYPTAGYVAVPGEVGHNVDQPNVGGLHIPSPMSPSKPTGVDGAITPQPAGVNAGTSVNPTTRNKAMQKVEFLTAWDVLAGPRHTAFVDAVSPVNGFTLSDVDGHDLIYFHANDRISWSGWILDSNYLESLEMLGTILLAGGADELAILRFPRKFGWADPKEALAFWQPLLPVNVARIMFTPMDMNYIYVQLVSGHILYLDLKWDGEDVYGDDLVQAIFLHIVDGCEVAR